MSDLPAGAGLVDEAYAALTPDLVIRAVESAGYRCDARVFALNSYENRVYQVGIEDQAPLVAKFYRPGRWSDAQLREEHAFTRELAAAELPVIAPLADATGETLFRDGPYRFALLPRKGGQGMEAGDPEQLYRIGLLLGRLHAVAAAGSFQTRPRLTAERFLAQPAQAVLRLLPTHWQGAYQVLLREITAEIEASGVFAWPGLRCQGDCHPGNVLWTRDDGPWLLDFDDCQTAPAVQDLWMLLCGDPAEQRSQLAELLEGYETFRELDRRELALIEPLRALRMVHYMGWLAMRWQDPAFPAAFPWFGSEACWAEHLQDLTRQLGRLRERGHHDGWRLPG